MFRGAKRSYIALFLFFLTRYLLLNGFDMRIFKVGQANFVLLTHKERALVVDCGVGSGYGGVLRLPRGTYGEEIALALAGVTRLGIIVTHHHGDHYNGIQQFKKVIDVINTQRRSDRDFELTDLLDMKVGETCNGWEGSREDIVSYVACYFRGGDVEIECIRPENFAEAFLSPEVVHDNNLLLLIHYKDVHILLSGDANSALLAHHLLHTEGFRQKLVGVNVLLAPHHGSTANGEHVWMDAIFNNDVEKRRILFVSSDPEQDHHLPKEFFYKKVRELGWRIHRTYLTSTAKAVCYRLSVDDNCSNIAIFEGAKIASSSI